MSDYISRQAAIEALEGWKISGEMILGIVPSADVRENIRGEWIDYSDEGYVECPFCHSATNCEGNKDELHYCFSCGAELR